MKNAWNLTEEEFENLRIPYKEKKGIYKSLNGKFTIEFKSDKPNGSAGLAYCFVFYINGKRTVAPFNYAQKLVFELPEDYHGFIVRESVIEYAKENDLYIASLI